MVSVKYLFTLTFICLQLLLLCQNEASLVLEYDLFNNKLTYKKNGVTTLTPSIKEGENIYVNVIEFNPYIMKAEVFVHDKKYKQSSLDMNGNDASFGSTGGLSGISGLFAGLDLGSTIQKAFSGIPGARGGMSEAMMEAKQEFLNLTAELTEAEFALNRAHQKIELFKTTEQSKNLAVVDIEKLKTNEHLRPSRIRELIQEEINYAFAKSSGEKIEISDLVSAMKMEEDLGKSLTAYNEAKDNYINLGEKWDKFTNSLSYLLNEEVVDQQFEYIQQKSDAIRQEIKLNSQKKFATTNEVKFNSDYSEKNIALLASLRQIQEEMESDIFKYSFPPVQAQGDEVTFDIVISKKSGLNDFQEYKTVSQTIPVQGGWKLSGGLGLAFGVLGKKSFEYSIVNNKIIGDEQDDFIPMFVSFAHAYKSTPSNVNFGGSFGIGFPLQGGAAVQSATFFGGPTLLIGSSQKFLLTAGVMGAKVNRLSGGYVVGDEYSSATNTIPFNQKYELGYFISLSYDIIKK